MKIETRNLVHIYLQDTPLENIAVEDVSIELSSREITAFLGKTGSGKSTLIQHFNGILRPTRGAVLIDGKNINVKGGKGGITRKVGLVFQFPELQLFEETLYADIAFGPRNLGWDEKEVETSVYEAVEMFAPELMSRMDDSPFELSGGEQRKAALCGIIAMKPDYLCLDEPTAGLDPRAKKELFAGLLKIHQSGKGIAFITHDINDAAEYSHRLLFMDSGKVALDMNAAQMAEKSEDLIQLGFALPDIYILSDYIKDITGVSPGAGKDALFASIDKIMENKKGG